MPIVVRLVLAVLLVACSLSPSVASEMSLVQCCDEGPALVCLTDNAKIKGLSVNGIDAPIEQYPVGPDKLGKVCYQVALPVSVDRSKPMKFVANFDQAKSIETTFLLANDLNKPGKQPCIKEIKPGGALAGSTVTIIGHNFGENIKQLSVNLNIDEGGVPLKLTVVSLDKNKDSKDKFNDEIITAILPNEHVYSRLLSDHSLYRRSYISVDICGYSSNSIMLYLVAKWGMHKLALVVIGFLLILMTPMYANRSNAKLIIFSVVFMAILAVAFYRDYFRIIAFAYGIVTWIVIWITRIISKDSESIFKTLLLDKDTNTYSLSKLQAFLWTITFIGTYAYLALGSGLFIGKVTIPDFNPGLLGLMGISYGGLVISKGISLNSPKNDLGHIPPRLSDFITENNQISMTRLQLFLFTFVVIAVYIYFIWSTDFFNNGMPDIPPTLMGLLALSQGGYIGGKVTNDIGVNRILPQRAKPGAKLSIMGFGLLDKTKIIFQDVPEPLPTKFDSPSLLVISRPETMGDPGKKQIIVVPPSGRSVVISDAFTAIEPKIASISRDADNLVRLTITGIELSPDEVVASVGIYRFGVEAVEDKENKNELTSKYLLKPPTDLPKDSSSLQGDQKKLVIDTKDSVMGLAVEDFWSIPAAPKAS